MKSTEAPLGLGAKFMFLAIVFVPFQQLLTIEVGFPLKISELLAGASVCLLIIDGRGRGRRPGAAVMMSALLVLVLLSVLFNLQHSASMLPHEGYPLGFTADMVTGALYGAFAIIVALVAASHLGPEQISRALLIGIQITAVVCAVQLAEWVLGLEFLEALNGSRQIGGSYSIPLTRNGPFLEGNYLGFYAGICLFLALRARRPGIVAVAAGCLVYSQSTVATVAVIAATALIMLSRPSVRTLGLLSFATFAVIAVIAASSEVRSFLTVQLGKLGLLSDPALAENVDHSREIRFRSADTAFRMAGDSPAVGVGPGRFGYWYGDFVPPELVASNYARWSDRPIVNNAYGQIAAELGLIALAAFIALLIILVARGLRDSRQAFGIAVFVAVACIATPSWSALPLWLGIAFLAALPGREASSSGVRTARVAAARDDQAPSRAAQHLHKPPLGSGAMLR